MLKDRLRRRVTAGALAVSFGAALFGGVNALQADEADWAGSSPAVIADADTGVQTTTGREESLIEADWA